MNWLGLSTQGWEIVGVLFAYVIWREWLHRRWKRIDKEMDQ